MPLPNPWYIDAEARHRASTQRLLANMATEGQEGVLDTFHLAVRALGTPGAGITVDPGGYGVIARHAGGTFETYLGKIASSLDVGPSGDGIVPVTAVSSLGPRTDLVILRIENPYVTGDGSWTQPADPLEGPYAHIRVIENVPTNINHVSQYNNTWSAITLARITRPASTGIVDQSHITDLRSLINLQDQRIIIITNPPPDPPPIAYQYWTESTPLSNFDELSNNDTGWVDFPEEANWDVPVPRWARGMDVNCILNPWVTDDIEGEFRLKVSGETTNAIPTDFKVTVPSGISGIHSTLMIGSTESLNQSWCGSVVNMRLQARSSDDTKPGALQCTGGVRVNIWINFKRFPNYNDGS